jgi:hypothetical protein
VTAVIKRSTSYFPAADQPRKFADPRQVFVVFLGTDTQESVSFWLVLDQGDEFGN